MSPRIGCVEGDFVIYAEEFREVLGRDPSLEKLVETDAHEGPVCRITSSPSMWLTAAAWSGTGCSRWSRRVSPTV